MKISRKKFILILFFILAGISLLRLLRITISTTSSSPPPSLSRTLLDSCYSPSPTCMKLISQMPHTLQHQDTFTEKEFRLLSDIIAHRAPCNLLVFGLGHQHLLLLSLNVGGTTLFLEDDPEKIGFLKEKSEGTTKIYKVEYQTSAREAYKLLKHARQDPACAPQIGSLQLSSCQLALSKLPMEVYELKWDVVVVDGPSGNSLEAPGRMEAIYTAGMLARRTGNTTDIIVHDVDRTIEKWFSWEFLCDENLVSSKGKLWHFRIITDQSNSTTFCSSKMTEIE